MQSRLSKDLVDSLVMAVLLFVTLWVAGLIWPGFGAFFGPGHSLIFALAYFVARAVLVLLKDEVYDRATRIRTRGPHPTG